MVEESYFLDRKDHNWILNTPEEYQELITKMHEGVDKIQVIQCEVMEPKRRRNLVVVTCVDDCPFVFEADGTPSRV